MNKAEGSSQSKEGKKEENPPDQPYLPGLKPGHDGSAGDIAVAYAIINLQRQQSGEDIEKGSTPTSPIKASRSNPFRRGRNPFNQR